MICEFETIKISDNEYFQKCKLCGHEQTTTTARLINFCKSKQGEVDKYLGLSPENRLEYVQKTYGTGFKDVIVSPPEEPGLLRKVFHFIPEALKHAAAGNPTCSQEQINARLQICAGTEANNYADKCPHFGPKESAEIGVCNHCGCHVKKEAVYLNALAWKDKQCPLNKWAEVDTRFLDTDSEAVAD